MAKKRPRSMFTAAESLDRFASTMIWLAPTHLKNARLRLTSFCPVSGNSEWQHRCMLLLAGE